MVGEGRRATEFGCTISSDREDSWYTVEFSSRTSPNAGRKFDANSAGNTFKAEFTMANEPSISGRNCYSTGALVSTLRERSGGNCDGR